MEARHDREDGGQADPPQPQQDEGHPVVLTHAVFSSEHYRGCLGLSADAHGRVFLSLLGHGVACLQCNMPAGENQPLQPHTDNTSTRSWAFQQPSLPPPPPQHPQQLPPPPLAPPHAPQLSWLPLHLLLPHFDADDFVSAAISPDGAHLYVSTAQATIWRVPCMPPSTASSTSSMACEDPEAPRAAPQQQSGTSRRRQHQHQPPPQGGKRQGQGAQLVVEPGPREAGAPRLPLTGVMLCTDRCVGRRAPFALKVTQAHTHTRTQSHTPSTHTHTQRPVLLVRSAAHTSRV